MQDSARESDSVLVAHTKEGDRAAFGTLVRRYQDAVCAIAYSRLGDVESAYDVAQEAFLLSLENLRQLRSGSKFGPWLRRITRRLCNRWQRSETYRRALRDELRQRAPARTTRTQDLSSSVGPSPVRRLSRFPTRHVPPEAVTLLCGPRPSDPAPGPRGRPSHGSATRVAVCPQQRPTRPYSRRRPEAWPTRHRTTPQRGEENR